MTLQVPKKGGFPKLSLIYPELGPKFAFFVWHFQNMRAAPLAFIYMSSCLCYSRAVGQSSNSLKIDLLFILTDC